VIRSRAEHEEHRRPDRTERRGALTDEGGVDDKSENIARDRLRTAAESVGAVRIPANARGDGAMCEFVRPPSAPWRPSGRWRSAGLGAPADRDAMSECRVRYHSLDGRRARPQCAVPPASGPGVAMSESRVWNALLVRTRDAFEPPLVAHSEGPTRSPNARARSRAGGRGAILDARAQTSCAASGAGASSESPSEECARERHRRPRWAPPWHAGRGASRPISGWLARVPHRSGQSARDKSAPVGRHRRVRRSGYAAEDERS
jgi:hypothetical protein